MKSWPASWRGSTGFSRTDVADDDAIRSAERRAYTEVGSDFTEHHVIVDDGRQSLDVRVLEIEPPVVRPALPPVLLLHGIASPSVLFAPLVPVLEKRQVLVVDWPGHGLSGPVRVPADRLKQHVSNVIADVLDEFGADRADIVGHSLGAQFALYTAVDQPERVRRVVTLGAPGAGIEGVLPIAAMKLMSLPGLGDLLLRLPTSERQFFRNAAMAMGPGVLEQQTAHVQRAARLAGSRSLNATGTASMFRALLRAGRVRPDVALTTEELRRISAPVLMFWGEDDVFLRPDDASASIEAIPDATLVRLDAGHAPWLEHPGAVALRIRDFLAADLPVADR